MVYQSQCQSTYMADKVRYVTVLPRMNPSGQPHGVNTEHKGCCNSVVDSSALPSLVSPVAWPYWVSIRKGAVLFNQHGDNTHWANIIRFQRGLTLYILLLTNTVRLIYRINKKQTFDKSGINKPVKAPNAQLLTSFVCVEWLIAISPLLLKGENSVLHRQPISQGSFHTQLWSIACIDITQKL